MITKRGLFHINDCDLELGSEDYTSDGRSEDIVNVCHNLLSAIIKRYKKICNTNLGESASNPH